MVINARKVAIDFAILTHGEVQRLAVSPEPTKTRISFCPVERICFAAPCVDLPRLTAGQSHADNHHDHSEQHHTNP